MNRRLMVSVYLLTLLVGAAIITLWEMAQARGIVRAAFSFSTLLICSMAQVSRAQ
jgi:hypothetical protein